MIKVCEFFNATTEDYRIAVLNLSKQAAYVIQKAEMTAFSLRIGTSLRFQDDYEASILFKLYFNNDLQIFGMLLEHGADPNTWGFMKKNNPRKALSILQWIAALNTSEYASYIQLLIRYGANPNNLVTTEEHHAGLKAKVSNVKKFRRQGISDGLRGTNIVQVNENENLPSPLVFSMNRGDLGVYSFLLPYMSADAIAYTFAQMTTDININSCQFPSQVEPISPIRFFNEQKTAWEIIPQQTTMKDAAFFNIFFYMVDGCKKEFNVKFKMFQMAYQMLAKKLTNVNSKQFDEIYQRLFSRGTGQVLGLQSGRSSDDGLKAYYCFFGCLCLLLTNASNLNSESQELDLFNQYHANWFKQIELVLPARLKNPIHLKSTLQIYAAWGEEIRKAFKTVRRNEPRTPVLLFSGTRQAPQILAPSTLLTSSPEHSFLIPSSSQSFSLSSSSTTLLPITLAPEGSSTSTVISAPPKLESVDSIKEGLISRTESLDKDSDKKILQERFIDITKKSEKIRAGDEQSSYHSHSDVYLPSGGPKIPSSSQQHGNLKQKTKKKKKKKKNKIEIT